MQWCKHLRLWLSWLDNGYKQRVKDQNCSSDSMTDDRYGKTFSVMFCTHGVENRGNKDLKKIPNSAPQLCLLMLAILNMVMKTTVPKISLRADLKSQLWPNLDFLFLLMPQPQVFKDITDKCWVQSAKWRTCEELFHLSVEIQRRCTAVKKEGRQKLTLDKEKEVEVAESTFYKLAS